MSLPVVDCLSVNHSALRRPAHLFRWLCHNEGVCQRRKKRSFQPQKMIVRPSLPVLAVFERSTSFSLSSPGLTYTQPVDRDTEEIGRTGVLKAARDYRG